MSYWPTKTSGVIVCFAAIMVALRFIPAFEQFGALRMETLASVFEFEGRSAAQTVIAETAHGQLIDRSHSLDTFYRALARVERREPGAVVQILHFGDSPISADQISADVRALLQERFGYAGEGFVLIAKPWPWYSHRGLEMSAKGWTIHAASDDFARDGIHGLGGATYSGGTGATASFRFPDAQQRVEISFWREPGGGSLVVAANSQNLGTISTGGITPDPGFNTVAVPATAREVRLTVTSGRVRLFGINFETDGPGVRYHSLGLNAGQIRVLLQHFEPGHWAAQLQHMHPDLVVINYGMNESGYPAYIDGDYAQDVSQLVRRVQSAAPDSSILLMSPMDRGVRNAHGEITTMAKLPKLVAIQRTAAADLGCAFFNTFQAMGGEGTMSRWYEARPRLASADFMHLLPAGARRVGTLVEQGLYQGYLEYKARNRNAR